MESCYQYDKRGKLGGAGRWLALKMECRWHATMALGTGLKPRSAIWGEARK